MLLNDDRLFPADPVTRGIARRLYAEIRNLPIISPHGHTDPRWYAEDKAFPDPATLFVKPDHYIFRMLYSQGVRLEQLGIAQFFQQVIGGDALPQKKPHPAQLLHACKGFGIAPQEMLMIGDSLNDAQAARSARLRFSASSPAGSRSVTSACGSACPARKVSRATSTCPSLSAPPFHGVPSARNQSRLTPTRRLSSAGGWRGMPATSMLA